MVDGTDPRKPKRVAVPPGQVDMVNSPPHYHQENSLYEPAKVIRAWGLSWALGDAVKYIARAGRKGDKAEDLRKAIWYITDEIDAIDPPVNLGARRLVLTPGGGAPVGIHGAFHDHAMSIVASALPQTNAEGAQVTAARILRNLGEAGFVLMRAEDVT